MRLVWDSASFRDYLKLKFEESFSFLIIDRSI